MSNAFDSSMELCKYIADDGCYDGILNRWNTVFFDVAVDCLGFSLSDTEKLWSKLAWGNWEHLHQTDEECKRTADDWLEEFHLDVFYCSDRWSLDRLTRCHWQFRQYSRKVTGGYAY